MGKNLVLCCDGTANQFTRNKTNVVKLFSTLECDPARQVAYYHPGLGTMEAVGALTTFSRRFTKLLGQAVGYGLESDIRDAYAFLMNCYEPGDRIFLFGFSRGAYTVRALASLLYMYGLIRKGNEPLIPYAIRMLSAMHAGPAEEVFQLASEFRQTFSSVEVCEIWFVGVWDTVSSVGWVENPLALPYTADNPGIHIGRHAVSIDERRAFFRTNLWRPADASERDLKQVWFPGVHCDVGGGYPEAESGLSQIALEWMLQEARAAGLLVNPARMSSVLSAPLPDAKARQHESLTGWWNLAEFIPKKHYNWKTRREEHRMSLYRRRTIPPGSLVHASAFEHYGVDLRRLPPDAVRVETQSR